MSEMSNKIPNLLTEKSELAGKTIAFCREFGYRDGILLQFTDKTVAVFSIEHGYEAGDAEVVLQTKLDDAEQNAAGLISGAEYQHRVAARRAREVQERLVRERAEYERLRKVFESQGES